MGPPPPATATPHHGPTLCCHNEQGSLLAMLEVPISVVCSDRTWRTRIAKEATLLRLPREQLLCRSQGVVPPWGLTEALDGSRTMSASSVDRRRPMSAPKMAAVQTRYDAVTPPAGLTHVLKGSAREQASAESQMELMFTGTASIHSNANLNPLGCTGTRTTQYATSVMTPREQRQMIRRGYGLSRRTLTPTTSERSVSVTGASTPLKPMMPSSGQAERGEGCMASLPFTRTLRCAKCERLLAAPLQLPWRTARVSQAPIYCPNCSPAGRCFLYE